MSEPKKRPPTSGTRVGNGRGLWGAANGPGWGGESRASGQARPRPMTPEERAGLRHEMIELYLEIARDAAQPALIRLSAAGKLLERLDDPFCGIS